jgi:hypothetical protein
MIDKILSTFPSDLGQILTPAGTSSTTTVTEINPYLPTPIGYLDIANVQLPLFGGILAGEMRVFEKLIQLQTDVIRGFNEIVAAIGATQYESVSDIRRALKLGQFQQYSYTTAKVAWTKLGQAELAAAATKQGVTIFTSTVTPEGDTTVQDIIVNYFDIWREAGFTQDTGLEMANAVLAKSAPVTKTLGTLVTFDAEEILRQCVLTWEEIEMIEDLMNPDVPYLLIIKFRVGIGSYNLLDYVPYHQRATIIESIKAEISTVPPSTEPVANNANVETLNPEGGTAENLT